MERADPRTTFGRKAAFYSASQAHTEEASLEALARLARVAPGMRVLDVATGAGHAAARLIGEGAEAVGLDLTRPMLLEARRLYGRKGLLLVQGDVSRLPFPQGAFDLVVSRRAPHHFPDIEGALASMRQALRPGGALVIEDRSVPEDDLVDRTMNHLDRLHDRSHVREYRPSEWRSMVQASGLALESMEAYRRQRPLSSLTQTAEPEDAAEIERMVREMSVSERERMGIEERDGAISVTHWFVLLRAGRP